MHFVTISDYDCPCLSVCVNCLDTDYDDTHKYDKVTVVECSIPIPSSLWVEFCTKGPQNACSVLSCVLALEQQHCTSGVPSVIRGIGVTPNPRSNPQRYGGRPRAPGANQWEY